eukprot:JP438963.1.p2 GENE.JP438963.1~~JP438963.1.p2  ORF type:complete len:109 (-),score=24.44 JP438963.1:101-388(-)
MCELQDFLNSLPQHPMHVLRFLLSDDAVPGFRITNHELVRKAMQKSPRVPELLEYLEETTMYWSERLRKGATMKQRTLEKLCVSFRLAADIQMSR